jgi:transcriptional regulator with XRE-family HTH domain
MVLMDRYRKHMRWKEFGRLLHDLRRARGDRLHKLAIEVGISQTTWYRAEHGGPLTVPTFLFLCHWMDVDPFSFCNVRPSRDRHRIE